MYNDRDRPIFIPLRISTIFFCPSVIKADHRVFHAVRCLHRNSHRVWIRDGIFGVRPQRQLHCFGGIFTIDRIGFLRVIAHAHHPFAILIIMRHGIPNKFPAGRPCKITHVVGFVNPRFHTFTFFAVGIFFASFKLMICKGSLAVFACSQRFSSLGESREA